MNTKNITNDRIQFFSLCNYDGNFSCVPLPWLSCISSSCLTLLHRTSHKRESATTRTYYRCTIPSSPVFHEKFWILFLVNFLTSRTWVIKRAEFEDGTPMEERSLELGVLAGWRLAEV